MPTLAEFYAPAHRGGAFGILPNSKYYGPTGHRGYDINGWAAGTQIPAFRAGRVVVNTWQAALGWVLVTYDAGEWFGYSHLDEQSPLGISEDVGLGDPIGPLGNTGTLSDGAHCHLTVSNASNSPWRGTTKDPWPYIAAALGSFTAGSGANPLEDDMPITDADVVKILTGEFDTGLLNPDGSPRWMTLAGSIRSILWYEDRIHGMAEKLPADVWSHPLVHPLAKVDGQPARVAAGELLRYEPAEHEATRRAVAAAASKSGVDIDYDELVASLKGSGLDPQAIAVYSADEADRRERVRLGK
ncbi:MULTISPECIES: M23 family metallopeptidase [Cryobacterium]|uniref:M23 family metallopeptidase n=1 Tax=Cryobacterium TaxID=69578 RepID=UPI000CD3F977|nr:MULTISPECIES: M23 family metallopeptidase [Cryobacterium]POH63645.1 hypothetical protein C3B60_16150 [Cryobacterium zongtaii]TFC45566.1 M23 family metallopeptidase [Cryobacterium sp. TMN-39-2]